MRKLLITGLVALTLVLALTVRSARFGSFAAHIVGQAHPMLAGGCNAAPVPC
jgi:hypothetical protein